MVQVCEGATDKAEMLRVALDQYKAMFEITQREFQKVANVSGGAVSHCYRASWFSFSL